MICSLSAFASNPVSGFNAQDIWKEGTRLIMTIDIWPEQHYYLENWLEGTFNVGDKEFIVYHGLEYEFGLRVEDNKLITYVSPQDNEYYGMIDYGEPFVYIDFNDWEVGSNIEINRIERNKQTGVFSYLYTETYTFSDARMIETSNPFEPEVLSYIVKGYQRDHPFVNGIGRLESFNPCVSPVMAYYPSVVEGHTLVEIRDGDGNLIFHNPDAPEESDVKPLPEDFSAESEPIYLDVMGRKVLSPRKGELYICNGRKVIF